ncbi:MAG: DUF2200 family protein [Clostridia bacterium]|nr:DUF2200 family protein [Clostridia bacterium]
MSEEKIYGMPFAKVYPLLIAKAERKGRTRAEVDALAAWMTGYPPDRLSAFCGSDLTYGDFFRNAPAPRPERMEIRGTVCGVRVAEIGTQPMRDIRILDLMVDRLAKGKTVAQITGITGPCR